MAIPKTILLSLFAFTLAVSLVSAASAQCGLLNIDYVDSETIAQGEAGGFTFSVYNSGCTILSRVIRIKLDFL